MCNNEGVLCFLQGLFAGHSDVGQYIYEHFIREAGSSAQSPLPGLDLETYVTLSQGVLDLVTTSQQLEYYCRALTGGQENLTKDGNFLVTEKLAILKAMI